MSARTLTLSDQDGNLYPQVIPNKEKGWVKIQLHSPESNDELNALIQWECRPEGKDEELLYLLDLTNEYSTRNHPNKELQNLLGPIHVIRYAQLNTLDDLKKYINGTNVWFTLKEATLEEVTVDWEETTLDWKAQLWGLR